MRKGLEIGKTKNVEPIKKMVGPLASRTSQGGGHGVAFETLVVIALLNLVLGVLLGLYGEALASLLVPLLRSVRGTSVTWQSIPVVGSFAKN